MLKIIVDNSNCKVEGLTIEQFRKLRQLLSYNIDSQATYFSGGFRSSKRYLITKQGLFPTGLLHRVLDFFKSSKTKFAVKELRMLPDALQDTFKLSLHLTPYPHQNNAVAACLKQHRGIISAVTGFGKSITMALLVAKLNVKTLIIVPNIQLKQQLTDNFKAYFGETKNVVIENIDNPKLFDMKDFDCLIIDEAHHVAAKTYRQLNQKAWNGIYYRFHFTATPFRSKSEEQILFESVAGQVIYTVDYKTSVESGYTVPVEAYYYELPKRTIKGNPNSWASMYKELIVDNDYRNRLIADIMRELHINNKFTLCLVKEIAHGDALSDLSGAGFANGEEQGSRDLIDWFANGKLRTLIGTTGVLGEGVDTKPAEYVIIAGLGKSKNAFMQQCGRGFRKWDGKESCKVILFKDPSHKWTLTHFKAQVKYLKEEYGVIPVKLDL